MSGTSPRLPESGWTILYNDALRAWLESGPSTLMVTPVMEWIASVEALGPPENGVSVSGRDDLYVAQVGDTRLTVTYLVVDYEFLVLVKDFA